MSTFEEEQKLEREALLKRAHDTYEKLLILEENVKKLLMSRIQNINRLLKRVQMEIELFQRVS